ncbi:hypothetical protein GCM10011505_14630 [Tistrella bauzanensis]|uniref:Insertion element IS402-like domain-containing protein n=1 Tax=Tistrella bauzanensis TaxID=657419 RepID=A0ABQ1IC41_9PROT|nr:hypothetical protein GCM10011505_14630 [Tistrella bauzanensis]
MREIVNAIFYVLRGGIAWRLLPKDLPPVTTVYGWFLRFRRDRVFEIIDHHLVMRDRERVGCEAGPSAAIIGSQSVETTESGAPRSEYDRHLTRGGHNEPDPRANEDPATTQIWNVRVLSHGAGGRIVCGEVNAKNSYVGFVRFAGTPMEVQLEPTAGSNYLARSMAAGVEGACSQSQAR